MESTRTAIAAVAACVLASVTVLAVAAAITGKWTPFGEGRANAEPPPQETHAAGGTDGGAAPGSRQPDGVACRGLPPATPGAEVIAVNAWNGGAYARLAIGGEAARVVDVKVDPGEGRIYLVLESAAPVVWRVSGDQERIERAVVAAPDRNAGVTGLFDGKVCFDLPGAADRAVEATAGGDVRSYQFREIKGVGLPEAAETDGNADGGPETPPKGADPVVWAKALERFGGPPAKLDPASVLSGGSKSEPDLLPSLFGVAQLVGSGAVRVMEAATPSGVETQYWIMRSVSFPRAMGDAPGLKFYLPSGVSFPEGDPGQSCVIDDETGQPVAGGCA